VALNAVVVLVGVLVAVCAAIVAVERLQTSAAATRDAELQLIALRLDLAQIQDVPWGASPDEGDNAQDVRDELQGVREKIEGSLAQLADEPGLPEYEEIVVPFRRSRAALSKILELAAQDRLDAVGNAPSVAARQTAVADEALRKAARRYDADSRRAMSQARAGSAAVIVLLFAAFAWVFTRVARARRRAESFAAENRRLLIASREEALTDALTGLRNRRALMTDLEVARPRNSSEQVMLALFDLDGFKQYNDTFGHPAGDALLARLGERLEKTTAGIGTAYRMGGDEFCIVGSVNGASDAIAGLAASALSESGEGFTIGCSYGVALMPADTRRSEHALLLADQRMYDQKASGRTSPGRQSADVLLQLLAERSSELGHHTSQVAALAERTAAHLTVDPDERRRIRLAAELHDVGKAAIPDAILNKPGPLDADEWRFIHRHTVIGERIVRAAPSLAHAADLVRWHHERFDGTGYPDAIGGGEIPLGARIIAVSDAFDAMISDRPYCAGVSVEKALGELRRCAGTQFDPDVVEAFTAVLDDAMPQLARAELAV
jgi:diguanylate cyclase (GGDEF)-like protein